MLLLIEALITFLFIKNKMPSVSKAQRRLFAMCSHGVHTEAKCPDMSEDKMHDFAATKETGLPKYVQQRRKSNKRRGKSS